MSLIFRRALAYAVDSAPKSFEPKVVDVLVVGGGPAGLTLAAGLKNSPIARELKISLIEGFNLQPVKDFHNNPPDQFSNRVVSLTPQSIEYLQKIGSWNHIKEERVQPYDEIIVTEGISDARLNLDTPELATMVENLNLQSSLYQRIKELESQSEDNFGLDILDNTKVTIIEKDPINNWPIVHLSNGEKIKTRLLVGADGFNSPVRKFSGIESRGWFYNRFGVVGTLKLEYAPYRSIGWQRFLPTGPIALLPLPNDNATLVWSQTIENSELLTQIGDDLFVELVNAGFILEDIEMRYYYRKIKAGETKGLTDDIKWRVSIASKKYTEDELDEKFPVKVISVNEKSRARFPLRLSHADSYVSDRIALVGDAAHTTHPLAGQGLNMGQGDVQQLVKAIEIGLQRGLDIGNTLVLEPYWANRYPENHMLLGVVDKLHKLYSFTSEPMVQLRSFGLNALNQISFIKNFMVKTISGK
ncbi:hypothetical protein WICMUC_000531 [Wickerhamomyces mucosus]|uniref:Ubiquinone biosynthesis monooxygenase COQ6, mitochondrial n=1 Tax=Wickerhamomyces mucosus TaxID=1378264 RepID=A0A9P8PYY8_9ASCO|nr:hypothetical protein WICMUC_000531 [Wickerhamomyces mucosus]